MLSLLHHSNLVNLIGYCADGDQRLLVYEYMALGSLEDHLHGKSHFSSLYSLIPHSHFLSDTGLPPNRTRLDWNKRMRIAAGAAKGLEYLHDKANPPVIYRDLKCSNILLGDGFHPKLSDFGLAKVGPVGDNTHVSTRVMGTYGYCAPEYAMTGQLTLKSDVYSFGVVLLELITGRKAIDNTRATAGEQNLVSWVSYDKFLRVPLITHLIKILCLILVSIFFDCRQSLYLKTVGNSLKWLILCSKASILVGVYSKLLRLLQCAFRNSQLQDRLLLMLLLLSLTLHTRSMIL